jgi:DNA ligase-1
MTLFARVAELAEQMAATSSRLKKRDAIAAALCAVHGDARAPEDTGRFAMYLAGMPFAESDARKLNAGGALLSRAVLTVSGAGDAELTAAYRQHGDLGAAAFDLLAKQQEKPATLTLAQVAEAFERMAAARTTAARAALVEGLLRRATALEAKYLLKLMLGDMRIGVKQSLVEEAIAVAASGDNSRVSAAQVRHAVMLEADLGSAVRRAFAGTLADARMRLFHPLGFMLASPVDSPEQAFARFRGSESGQQSSGGPSEPGERQTEEEAGGIEAFLEDKYDGMRAQVHFGDPEQPGRVAIYSRNREDITGSYPEIVEAFARVDPAAFGPLIFDGEILGWDFGAANGQMPRSSKSQLDPWETSESRPHALPFAVLGQRIGRKQVSNQMRAAVPVVFMVFDLLFADGELTLELPLHERRKRLEAIVERLVEHAVAPLELAASAPAQSHLFAEATASLEAATALPRLILSPARLVESAADIDRAYGAARARSNEGVMIKDANSVYQPGRRGLAWVKLKRELATLDVVITGAEYGHGKRAGLLSDYTFAVRGPDFARTGELLNVGKAYSGVTDAEIEALTAFLKEHTLEDHGHFRTVEPLILLEVAFNNVMRSTRHASGFALRFPRILRLRTDKPLAEIDSLDRVEEIYQSQVDKPVE